MFIDIAANLTDEMFDGVYHGKPRHLSDRREVFLRALSAGCTQMVVLAGSLSDAEKCAEICRELDPDGRALYTTIGVHPTRCDTIASLSAEDLEQRFTSFIHATGETRVVAIGELGLDYDRLQFCDKAVQTRFFELQLRVASKFGLPLLLHLRNAFDDFVQIMERNKSSWVNSGGVVHSFTGTRTEMTKLVDMGFYIGLNGCSLRDVHLLTEVIPNIPEDRIIFETDAPYCDIRPTHSSWKFLLDQKSVATCKPEKWQAGMLVKGRNEPACIFQVAQVVANVRRVELGGLCNAVEINTRRLFRKLARIV